MNKNPTNYSEASRELAINLHKEVSLTESNWHLLKNNHKRRAAELLSAALVQLIQDGNKKDIEQLINQSLLWLRREINDPGCPK